MIPDLRSSASFCDQFGSMDVSILIHVLEYEIAQVIQGREACHTPPRDGQKIVRFCPVQTWNAHKCMHFASTDGKGLPECGEETRFDMRIQTNGSTQQSLWVMKTW